VILKQSWQSVIFVLMSVIASASNLTSSDGIRRRWYAMRCALLGPTPGNLVNSSINRATGGAAGMVLFFKCLPCLT
jgi:hypothetical protein